MCVGARFWSWRKWAGPDIYIYESLARAGYFKWWRRIHLETERRQRQREGPELPSEKSTAGGQVEKLLLQRQRWMDQGSRDRESLLSLSLRRRFQEGRCQGCVVMRRWRKLKVGGQDGCLIPRSSQTGHNGLWTTDVPLLILTVRRAPAPSRHALCLCVRPWAAYSPVWPLQCIPTLCQRKGLSNTPADNVIHVLETWQWPIYPTHCLRIKVKLFNMQDHWWAFTLFPV